MTILIIAQDLGMQMQDPKAEQKIPRLHKVTSVSMLPTGGFCDSDIFLTPKSFPHVCKQSLGQPQSRVPSATL